MSKIGILTLPMLGNYGGMLQQYALQNALINNQIESSVIDILPEDVIYQTRNITSIVKIFILKLLYRFKIGRWGNISPYLPILQIEMGINFTKKHLKNIISVSPSNIAENTKSISCFIVGSDQVWRTIYTRNYTGSSIYCLSFATDEQVRKSVAYAASFGIDKWEGNNEETALYREQLNKFIAISTREESGVHICMEVFQQHSLQMPDPTFLVYKREYDNLIKNEATWRPKDKYIASYCLDLSQEIKSLIEQTSAATNMKHQSTRANCGNRKYKDRVPYSVPQWLRLIRDCEYFITDSFHGCVFAIIYNKPFVCLGNEARGNARFDTLLGTFGLEDRMITDATPEKVIQVLNTPIDWARVNVIHDTERERGISFLKENLTDDL